MCSLFFYSFCNFCLMRTFWPLWCPKHFQSMYSNEKVLLGVLESFDFLLISTYTFFIALFLKTLDTWNYPPFLGPILRTFWPSTQSYPKWFFFRAGRCQILHDSWDLQLVWISNVYDTLACSFTDTFCHLWCIRKLAGRSADMLPRCPFGEQ